MYEHAPELGVRPGRFSFGVAGDSAGANLAACLALRAQETSFPRLDYQILICPVREFNLLDNDVPQSQHTNLG